MTNGNGMLNKVIAGIATAGVLGGVGLAIAQGRTSNQVETNTSVLVRQSEAVGQIDVIAAEIGHVKEDVEIIREENLSAHEAIKKDMDKNHEEVMRAIHQNHR